MNKNEKEVTCPACGMPCDIVGDEEEGTMHYEPKCIVINTLSEGKRIYMINPNLFSELAESLGYVRGVSEKDLNSVLAKTLTDAGIYLTPMNGPHEEIGVSFLGLAIKEYLERGRNGRTEKQF